MQSDPGCCNQADELRQTMQSAAKCPHLRVQALQVIPNAMHGQTACCAYCIVQLTLSGPRQCPSLAFLGHTSAPPLPFWATPVSLSCLSGPRQRPSLAVPSFCILTKSADCLSDRSKRTRSSLPQSCELARHTPHPRCRCSIS